MELKFSSGNVKTGAIPAFNIPPVETCLNHSTCSSFKDSNGRKRNCYAKQSYKMYPNAKKVWDTNYALAKSDLNEFKRQLIKYFKRFNGRFFRIHVSGDFFSKEYLNTWIEVIKEFKHIKFLAYTKVYGFFKGLELPKNFTVLLSFMPSIPVNQALNFSKKIGLPIAYAGEKPLNMSEDKFITCPEQTTGKKITCADCKLCWNVNNLKRPVNIHFIPH